MRIFWAWQFDLPGKIARHFIRNALEIAIAEINQTEDIDEPDEAFQEGKLQLDYGRKNLKGSPDLALEILKKIDAAGVFVGDVTPVGRGAPHRTDEGVESDGKALMNPNVAIELGYALKSKGTDHVLMVMNSHYGKRADMPFDLGGKGGPIMYNLAPGATAKEIETEKRKLVAVLVNALKEYVPKPEPVPFPALKPQIGDGIFFKDGEVIAEDKNSRDQFKYTMPFRSIMWLRVMPSFELEMPIDRQTLLQSASRCGTFGAPTGGEPTRENAYGVIFFSPAGPTPRIDSLTQYTRDGEIWGINADILRQGEHGQQRVLLTLPMENNFIVSLELYMRFMKEIAEAPVPIQVEAGLQGVKGCLIAHNSYSSQSPTMHRDEVKHRGLLRTFEKEEQLAFLIEFFKKVNAASGVPRPDKLYGRG